MPGSSAVVLLVVLLGVGRPAGATSQRAECRRRCGDTIARCVPEHPIVATCPAGRERRCRLKASRRCRQNVRRRCRRDGLGVCLLPVTTTVPGPMTTSSSVTSSSTTSSTTSTSAPARCGNGVLDPGEECDGSCADLGCVPPGSPDECTCCSTSACVDGRGCCPGLRCVPTGGPGGLGHCTPATCGGLATVCSAGGLPCCAGFLCAKPNGFPGHPYEFCCLPPGRGPCAVDTHCCAGTCDGGVCRGGVRCCEFRGPGVCTEFFDAVAHQCSTFEGTLGAPGHVCDGATGSCQPARTGAGSCCEFTSGAGCFEGPAGEAFRGVCVFSEGTEFPGAACLPTGRCERPTCLEGSFPTDLCGGSCPPGSVCATQDLSTCTCVAGTQPCGTTAPVCNGVCPAGEACVSLGGLPLPGCGCVPLGSAPCGDAAFPACRGDCPSGSVCRARALDTPSGGGGCVCSPPGPCDATCGGADCPTGFVCAALRPLPACSCAPTLCGGSFPACGGTCPSGLACMPLVSGGGVESCACGDPTAACESGCGGIACPAGQTCAAGAGGCSCRTF
jgi:hypothetical protein